MLHTYKIFISLYLQQKEISNEYEIVLHVVVKFLAEMLKEVKRTHTAGIYLCTKKSAMYWCNQQCTDILLTYRRWWWPYINNIFHVKDILKCIVDKATINTQFIVVIEEYRDTNMSLFQLISRSK